MPTVSVDFQSRSFQFACDIVLLFKLLDGQVPREMARQILKAGTSVGANLCEGRSAQSRKDLRSKFAIALKEARETHFWLRLIAATYPKLETTVADALDESNQLVAILTTSVIKLSEPKDPEPEQTFPSRPATG
jgi:four helix bundle protein